jgi:hypothetical protein
LLRLRKGQLGLVIPTDTMTDAYHRLIDRLGLLTSEEIAKVIQAYLAARQLPAKLAPIGNRSDDWIRVESQSFGVLRTLHTNHAKLMDDAIKAIEHAMTGRD